MLLLYAVHAVLIGGLVFMVLDGERELSRQRAIGYSVAAGALWPITVDGAFIAACVFIIIAKRVYRG